MKVALINPNTSVAITETMVEIAAATAGPGTRIVGHTAGFGTALITNAATLARAAEAVAAMAPALAGYDAVIVAAFGDPGLARLRAALDIPVTGIAEAGMREAAEGDRCFAVVTTTPALVDSIAATAAKHRHTGFLGTWTTRGDPAELTADSLRLEARLAEAVEAAVRESHAEAIVIGGGPLAQAAHALAATAPVPLIQPIPAAVRLTRARLAQAVAS
jgi:Asp/Glu/hydantoin racemase